MLLIFVILLVSISKNFTRSREIKGDVSGLEEEVKRLEGRNQELGKLLDYFNTDAFVEEQARLKLGLQKPGESVIVIPEEEKKDGETPVGTKNKERVATNPQKWWDYFFKVK